MSLRGLRERPLAPPRFAFSPPDTTLPVLELFERDQRLHAVLRDLQHGGVLQEFETLQGKAQPSPAR